MIDDELKTRKSHSDMSFFSWDCRFCVCLAKDTSRMVRLRSVLPIVEDYCSTVPAELLVFVRVPPVVSSPATSSPASSNTEQVKPRGDWEIVVVRTRNADHREKVRAARLADGFTLLERRPVALGNGALRKESSETDVGEERVLRKRSRKSVQFALPQVPLRVPISWPVLSASIVGDACAVKERERSTPLPEEGADVQSVVSTAPNGATTNPGAGQNNGRWQMTVWDEFTDCVLEARVRPGTDVESYVRHLLEREQDRLTRAAYEAAGVPMNNNNNNNENLENGMEQSSNPSPNIRMAFEGSSDGGEDQGKERAQKSPEGVLDLNAVEFRAQFMITAPPMGSASVSLNSSPVNDIGRKVSESKQRSEAIQTAVYDVSFSLHQVP